MFSSVVIVALGLVIARLIIKIDTLERDVIAECEIAEIRKEQSMAGGFAVFPGSLSFMNDAGFTLVDTMFGPDDSAIALGGVESVLKAGARRDGIRLDNYCILREKDGDIYRFELWNKEA